VCYSVKGPYCGGSSLKIIGDFVKIDGDCEGIYLNYRSRLLEEDSQRDMYTNLVNIRPCYRQQQKDLPIEDPFSCLLN
jgi:hypothetical protein